MPRWARPGFRTSGLFAQEIPSATLAMFKSKMKYVNAPNFEKFREKWNAQYLDGFIVHISIIALSVSAAGDATFEATKRELNVSGIISVLYFHCWYFRYHKMGCK